MNLIWSPEALDDLLSIRRYIGHENPRAATAVVSTILQLVQRRLSDFPYSGRQGRVEGTHELVVPGLPFVVPYRIVGSSIEVIRVYHASRRWPDHF